jgi:hypothetical protein
VMWLWDGKTGSWVEGKRKGKKDESLDFVC